MNKTTDQQINTRNKWSEQQTNIHHKSLLLKWSKLTWKLKSLYKVIVLSKLCIFYSDKNRCVVTMSDETTASSGFTPLCCSLLLPAALNQLFLSISLTVQQLFTLSLSNCTAAQLSTSWQACSQSGRNCEANTSC